MRMNDKTKFMSDLKKKREEDEEREELCGPRLQLKIDRMLQEYNQNAGLDDNGNRQNEEEFY